MTVTTGGRVSSESSVSSPPLQADLDVGSADALDAVAELGRHHFGDIGVDGLVDGRHHAHAHQRLDDVVAPLGHAVGQLLDGDRLGNDHVADNFQRRVGIALGGPPLLLACPPDRRQAAHALVLVERLADRQLATAAALSGAAHRRGAPRGTAGPPLLGALLDLAAALLLLLDEALGRLLLGLDARRLFGTLALLLELGAPDRGVALGLQLGLLLGAARRLDLGPLTRLGVSPLGPFERTGPSFLLVVGELAKDDAGAARDRLRLLDDTSPARRPRPFPRLALPWRPGPAREAWSSCPGPRRGRSSASS